MRGGGVRDSIQGKLIGASACPIRLPTLSRENTGPCVWFFSVPPRPAPGNEQSLCAPQSITTTAPLFGATVEA